MEKRPLNTPEGIHADLLYRAWQERAAQATEALAAEIAKTVKIAY